jgi:tetratricopeptide (TPR) repeat protein
VTQLGEITDAIAALAHTDAVGVDRLDAFRRHLEERKVPEHRIADCYCLLSEALLHRGCGEEAVESARIAFEGPATEEIAHLCAWVFSNCGRHGEAAAAYERLLQFRPQWAEGHRHASGSFAAVGLIDRAMVHARSASDLDANSLEFAWHAAVLFQSAGRYQDAADYFARAAAIEPEDVTVLRHLSSAKFALAQQHDAVALALRAVSLAPGDRLAALHATELLLRTGRLDEAAEIIIATVGANPQDQVAFRLLSETEMLRGRTQDALDAIDRALDLAPEVAEHHLHRAGLLYRLGCLDQAAAAFGRAATLDPTNADARRSQLTVYFDSGRLTEALAVGGELISRTDFRRCSLTYKTPGFPWVFSDLSF